LPKRIELHRADSQGGKGLVEMRHPRSGEKVFVDPTPALTIADIAEVHLQIPEDWPVELVLTFAPSGQERMSALSRQHNGRLIAVFVEGKLRAAAPLLSEAKYGILIGGAFSKEEAEEISRKAESPKTEKKDR
jgi:preprotein translocase subunit SecD